MLQLEATGAHAVHDEAGSLPHEKAEQVLVVLGAGVVQVEVVPQAMDTPRETVVQVELAAAVVVVQTAVEVALERPQ